jgi:hypothetical protein
MVGSIRAPFKTDCTRVTVLFVQLTALAQFRVQSFALTYAAGCAVDCTRKRGRDFHLSDLLSETVSEASRPTSF